VIGDEILIIITINVSSITTVNALHNCLQQLYHDKSTDRCRPNATPTIGILILVINYSIHYSTIASYMIRYEMLF